MFIYHSKKNETPENRVTVVGTVNEDILYVAASRCSSKDHFEKKVGTNIASERLLKGKLCFKSSLNNENFRVRHFLPLAKVIAKSVSENPKLLEKRIF